MALLLPLWMISTVFLLPSTTTGPRDCASSTVGNCYHNPSHRIPLPTTQPRTPGDCCAACWSHPQCVSYTFWTERGKPSCNIFSTVGSVVNKTTCVSGTIRPTPTPAWRPHYQVRGSYDAGTNVATPFWWPKDKRMYLMEDINRGPLDPPGWGTKYGYYWGHAEQWHPEYLGHSYFRIRDMKTSRVVANVSHSIGLGFPAAFVDYGYDKGAGMLWVAATPNDRGSNRKGARPFGPPHDYNSSTCGNYSTGRWECGVYMFNSSDLVHWDRTKTDIAWGGPNIDLARVYSSNQHPTPPNLPEHRYVMTSEKGVWMVNNNADGDLRSGWITLTKQQAHGGSVACPSVRYLPSDGYYYTVSGGHQVILQRSRDLLHWEKPDPADPAVPFIQASDNDTLVASGVMDSAASNLARGFANLSFGNRTEWDHDSNDADLCCESWGGASPAQGGPEKSYVLWGCDGQGASGWKDGPEGFACIGTADMPLDQLLQSYFA